MSTPPIRLHTTGRLVSYDVGAGTVRMLHIFGLNSTLPTTYKDVSKSKSSNAKYSNYYYINVNIHVVIVMLSKLI